MYMGHCTTETARPLINTHNHTHSDWSSQVSADAHKSFLRAAELGYTLKEPWLVSNAVVYLWNYSHHYLEQGRLSELVEVFRPLLATIKQAQLQK